MRDQDPAAGSRRDLLQAWLICDLADSPVRRIICARQCTLRQEFS
jgi:hypothetical protein